MGVADAVKTTPIVHRSPPSAGRATLPQSSRGGDLFLRYFVRPPPPLGTSGTEHHKEGRYDPRQNRAVPLHPSNTGRGLLWAAPVRPLSRAIEAGEEIYLPSSSRTKPTKPPPTICCCTDTQHRGYRRVVDAVEDVPEGYGDGRDMERKEGDRVSDRGRRRLGLILCCVHGTRGRFGGEKAR